MEAAAVVEFLLRFLLFFLIVLIASGVRNFFQKDNSEMVQENQGTFEVVTVNEEEE